MLGVAYYHADDTRAPSSCWRRSSTALPRGSIERREAEQVLGLSTSSGRFAEAIPLLEGDARVGGRQPSSSRYIARRRPTSRRAARRARDPRRSFGVAPDSAAAHLLAAQMMIRLEMEPHARPS